MMKKQIFTGLVMAGMMVGQLQAADVKLDNDKKKFSYTLGYQIAQNLARQGALLDADAAAKAVHDAFSGKKPALTIDEMKAVVARIQDEAKKKHSEIGSNNLAAGKKFLTSNAKKDGVKTLDSGLQYKVLIKGDGEIPKASSTVVAHYEGRLINDKVFDSSIQRGSPATFPVKGVIPGWQEILQLMPTGSKWQVYIPSKLAYGEKGAGASIGPNETLIFDIELISIN
ncbi:MAG: FKBP-type peptidyl-prolyl cis-trans isomerase [Sulfuriflexus sp.]|nr:FKBP-type peptidyl-prolyl cis-trans isomerase [Sulfuriflexus sp.]